MFIVLLWLRMICFTVLTLSHPDALSCRVKLSGVRQSKVTNRAVLAGLGGKGLRMICFTV